MVSENWGRQKRKDKGPSLRKELEGMNMNELRKFVKKNNLKAADTSKSELIEEIMGEMEKQA